MRPQSGRMGAIRRPLVNRAVAGMSLQSFPARRLLRSFKAQLADQRTPLLALGPDVAADVLERSDVDRDQAQAADAVMDLGQRHDALHFPVQLVHDRVGRSL